MHLPDFGRRPSEFEVVFTTGRPELDMIKNVDWNGAILCDLHCWRACQPNEFINNLLYNTAFRDYIEYHTGSSADQWYNSINRSAEEV